MADTLSPDGDRLGKEAASARKLVDHLDQAILAKAFRGELVPQDPNDEPASVLLERIKKERSPGAVAKNRLSCRRGCTRPVGVQRTDATAKPSNIPRRNRCRDRAWHDDG